MTVWSQGDWSKSFNRPDALPVAHPTAANHWRHYYD